jgi:hypothetical protein
LPNAPPPPGLRIRLEVCAVGDGWDFGELG